MGAPFHRSRFGPMRSCGALVGAIFIALTRALTGHFVVLLCYHASSRQATGGFAMRKSSWTFSVLAGWVFMFMAAEIGCGPAAHGFIRIQGNFAQVQVGSNGSVFGINSSQQIFSFDNQTQRWVQLSGLLTQ